MSVRSKITPSRLVAVGAAAAAVLAVGAGAGAVAGNLVTSADIEDGAVRSPDLFDGGVRTADIHDGAVYRSDLSAGLEESIVSGKVSKLESDGPYPGQTDLGNLGTAGSEGDNSDALVLADGEAHTVWVQCATDKVALGGGFRLAADAGTAAAQAVQVTASEPTQIVDGAIVYEPIDGDAAGSFVANGWAVEAINTGASPVVVRPWVVCGELSTP
jgi:hypothetical protein